MVNFMAFLSSFASYLFVFFVFVITILVAVAIGVTAAKIVNKNKKTDKVAAQEAGSEEANE